MMAGPSRAGGCSRVRCCAEMIWAKGKTCKVGCNVTLAAACPPVALSLAILVAKKAERCADMLCLDLIGPAPDAGVKLSHYAAAAAPCG